MANIVCYDSDGSILRYYTQWDTDQKLVIMGADISSAPVFHFLNAYKNTAYVVQSEIISNSIVVKVPDVLLQYDVPIIVYIYYESGTTEYSVRIPVMPRVKPSDYIYIDPGSGDGGSSVTKITIANNLTTNDPEVALSAAQGVVIKSLLDDVEANKLESAELLESINTALILAKESGEFKGEKGDPGVSGRGIVSILRTNGDGSAGTYDIYTITYTDNTTSTFSVYNGANGTTTSGGSSGSVGAGENGATFTPHVSADGTLTWTNDKGFANPAPVNITGPQGIQGIQGKSGTDGFSPIISVAAITGGSRISITDATGTKTFDVLNGVDGKAGADGSAGQTGADGHTPIKGTDYWTSADKSEIVNDVLAALPVWMGGNY